LLIAGGGVDEAGVFVGEFEDDTGDAGVLGVGDEAGERAGAELGEEGRGEEEEKNRRGIWGLSYSRAWG
jgi:hypothetical protein